MIVIWYLFVLLTAGYYIFTKRSSEAQSVTYLTSPNQNLELNRTYCLSFYYYVAASARRPSPVSLSVSVTSEQVCNDSSNRYSNAVDNNSVIWQIYEAS